MDIKKVYAVYFSPTGTTEKTAIAIAEGAVIPYEKFNLTTREARRNFKHSFKKNELAIIGLPVYGGRLPKNLDDFFSGLHGNATPAIALVLYGNREYEDALIELKLILEERRFKVIAGAAFIGEHTFSKKIATGRPDAGDLAIANDFGKTIVKNINKMMQSTLHVKGNYPFKVEGFDPAKPRYLTASANIITMDNCTSCGLCAEDCPWGAIDTNDFKTIDSLKCFRCFQCIKNCPVNAKAVKDEQFFNLLTEFEMRLNARRCEPELFPAE
ncbi:MAG: hypothetical protein A2Y58_04250 [Chloroflexi bacterium RBG_13_51_52]|nr:MAG: hypothetical protein A2Y58_04250 [Chloroflexi bacterium RBG_13_51_52]